MMILKDPTFWARFSHWAIGFLVHISFSISALVVAIKDWDSDCEDDNSLEISGSGWLITCEVVSVLYSLLLLPGFIWWEPRVNKKSTIALKIYFVSIIILFTIFFVIWDAIGIFLLFEEIENCRGSSLWVMSVITLIRSWLHFMYPTSVVIVREIEDYFKKEKITVVTEPSETTE